MKDHDPFDIPGFQDLWKNLPAKVKTEEDLEAERDAHKSHVRAEYFRTKVAFDRAKVAYEILFGKVVD
jgi:hypothetical protein